MTNNHLARTSSVDAIKEQEERTVFGVTQMVIERMNECLQDQDEIELRWSSGAQEYRKTEQYDFIRRTVLKRDATHKKAPPVLRIVDENDVSQYSDGRKNLFRQRFNRLKNNVISHKN